MVTFSGISRVNSETPYCEGYCLSTDVKPTEDIRNGSILVEIDTGKVFFFNEDSSTWVEQFSFQG